MRGRELCKLLDKFNMVEFVELGIGGDWLVTGLVASRRRGIRDRLGQRRRNEEKQKEADLRKLDFKSKGTRRGSKKAGQSSKFKKTRKAPPIPLHAVPGAPGCVCLRKLKLVLCKDCGNTFRGRVRRLCKIHPNSIYLLDMEICKDCNQGQLQELDLPMAMMKGGKNQLVRLVIHHNLANHFRIIIMDNLVPSVFFGQEVEYSGPGLLTRQHSPSQTGSGNGLITSQGGLFTSPGAPGIITNHCLII